MTLVPRNAVEAATALLRLALREAGPGRCLVPETLLSAARQQEGPLAEALRQAEGTWPEFIERLRQAWNDDASGVPFTGTELCWGTAFGRTEEATRRRVLACRLHEALRGAPGILSAPLFLGGLGLTGVPLLLLPSEDAVLALSGADYESLAAAIISRDPLLLSAEVRQAATPLDEGAELELPPLCRAYDLTGRARHEAT